jgi:hypothetical protein
LKAGAALFERVLARTKNACPRLQNQARIVPMSLVAFQTVFALSAGKILDRVFSVQIDFRIPG